MSTNRSADAGILGFTYQFLQTAVKILEIEDVDTVFTVEGIEDLDISTAGEEELVQYKYHEAKKYTPSAIQKPVSLMFKHFIENYLEEQDWNIKYTLFCYFGMNGFENSNLITSVNELKTILNYTESKKILENKKWPTKLEEEFLKYLTFSNADNFDDVYKNLIEKIKNTFQISEVESEIGYFSNAVFYINKLAIQKDIMSRKLTKRQFIDYLKTCVQKNEAAIIQRLYGKEQYIRTLKKYLNIKNVKPSTTSHIFYLSSVVPDTPRFIVDLVKKFAVSGQKKDVKPITLIVNVDDRQQIGYLKKELSQISVLEKLDLIFNDGNEDYYFNHKYFNISPLISLQKNQQKIERISYNYKLISFETYKSNQDNIYFDNPLHIFIEDSQAYQSLNNYTNLNKISINGLTNQNILQLFGG